MEETSGFFFLFFFLLIYSLQIFYNKHNLPL